MNEVFAKGTTSGGGVTPPPVPANQAPVIVFTSPDSRITSTTTSVTATANVSDPDGTISKVEFYLNGSLKKTVTTAPYTASLSTLIAGKNEILLKAFDNVGATTTAKLEMNYSSTPVVDPNPGGGGTTGGSGSVTPPGSNDVTSILTKELYEEMFPYRNGTAQQGANWVRTSDFFSYDKLKDAISRMSNIQVKLERRCATGAYRITRIDKVTHAEKIIREDEDFKTNNGAILIEYIDYGDFCNSGSSDVRKRELMAFLANIAHETTGGWATAPGGKFAWGLYFKEEVGYTSSSAGGYVDAGSTLYPPTAGKSYHGRGPIQLSWNYNYGQVSEFLYGDKTILLKNPEKVAEDGSLAFQTAIWFWMTPQHPKPSAHDIMIGKWIPSSADKTRGLVPGFGATINVINGGIECGSGAQLEQVTDRIGHYDKFTQIVKVSKALDGTNSTTGLNCSSMKEFQLDYNECKGLPGGGTEPAPSGSSEHCGLLEWSTTKVYNGGDKIFYNGYTYEAAYWTQGNQPSTNNGNSGEPWKNKTICDGSGTSGGGGVVPTPPVSTNVNPIVGISSPSNGSAISALPLSVTATASDPDGTISKVEIYLNGSLIKTATSAPYSAYLTALTAGSNTIMAKAFDNSGGNASATVSVTYTTSTSGGTGTETGTGGGECQGVESWSSSKVYNTGDKARDGEIIYKANYWTQNNKPNENQGSGKPWTVVSKCDGTIDASAFGETKTCAGKQILVWKTGTAYDKAGTEVFYNGNVYKSKYWTQGNTPGSSDPWTLVSPCN